MTRVCVFYSKGRSFLEVLKVVRGELPDAHVTAMTPPAYTMSPDETAAADVHAQTEQAAYSAKSPGAFLRLVSQIRSARYDLFVITFDSTRLRVLAALSGARGCAYCSLDGRLVTIRPTVAGTIAGTLARNIWGRLVYAWVWTVVRVVKVTPTAQR